MALIEKISEMQKQGLSNNEIIRRLQEEGSSPRDISEALDQNKVKSAVSTTEEMQPSLMPPVPTDQMPESPEAPIPTPPEQSPSPVQEQMLQTQMPTKLTEQGPLPQPTDQGHLPQPTEQLQQTEQLPPGQAYGYEEYPAYPQYPEYESAQAGTEMMAEVAEQLVSEKLEKLKKQISEITGFKTEAGSRIENIDERLRRIEIIIDRLQTSILGKIGEYGRNISDLKEEMSATQESFSKILNPLTENIEEMRKITRSKAGKKTEPGKKHKTGTKRKRKKGDGFEKYLRR